MEQSTPITDETASPLLWFMLEVLEDLLYGEPSGYTPISQEEVKKPNVKK